MRIPTFLGCICFVMAGCAATDAGRAGTNSKTTPQLTKEQQAEQRAIFIAKQAVAKNDHWPMGATYSAQRDRDGWSVIADRIVNAGVKFPRSPE